MTIDEKAIKTLNEIIDEGWLISDMEKCTAIDACEFAIDRIHKYQKIQKIVDKWHHDIEAKDYECMAEIAEVIKMRMDECKELNSDKQALLDSLAKEPIMVLSTAYVYAKNYVEYGEDITKEWATAVKQAYVIQKVKQKAWAEAYDSFKKDYENRLKADMVAMLKEIDLQFDEICFCRKAEWKTVPEIKAEYKAVIQQKINSLKEDTNQ